VNLRRWFSDHPTARGFLVIAAIALVVVVLSLESTLTAIGGLLRIAFFLAIAFFLFLLWKERRSDIETWSERGKRVFYATHVGLFELTERGMTLTGLMPGIDLRRDVLDASAMRIVLPASGRVPTLPATLFTTGDWAPPARPVKKRHATRRNRRASA